MPEELTDLHQPGPAKDGFRLHVFADDGRVVIEFGIGLTHLPMPPDSAMQLAKAVYDKWVQIDPKGMIFDALSICSVSPHDGEVLVEFPTEINHIRLMPGQARSLCIALVEATGKITNQPVDLSGLV